MPTRSEYLCLDAVFTVDGENAPILEFAPAEFLLDDADLISLNVNNLDIDGNHQYDDDGNDKYQDRVESPDVYSSVCGFHVKTPFKLVRNGRWTIRLSGTYHPKFPK